MPNRITQFPVPLILKKILKDKSSGELIVVGKSFTKNLFFSEGNLIFAKSDMIEERIGEILFKIGKINREQFMNINELIKSSHERIGKLLVQEQMLNRRDLFFGLVYQLRTIATSTFSLASGEWNFINALPDIPQDSRFNIHLPGIITEGTNKLSSISYFREKFNDKVPKISPLPEFLKTFLSNYEVTFYHDLEQHKNLSTDQVFTRMKLPEDNFWKKIVLFYLLNVIEFVDVRDDRVDVKVESRVGTKQESKVEPRVEPRVEPKVESKVEPRVESRAEPKAESRVGARQESRVDKEPGKNVEEILRLYDQLKSNRLNYYELLAVNPTATPAEMKDAYFNLAKKYHPDRVSTAGDLEIKEKANYVFAEINKAYETLNNPDKRNIYDAKGFKEENRLEPSEESQLERARMLHRRAKSLFSQKKYWEAISALEEAVKLDTDKASYFLLLGLCQMNLPQLRRMAAQNLQKSIDLESLNVEAFRAMGNLFLLENQPLRAEGFFRKVLSINPEDDLARTKLEEITGKVDKKKGKFSLFGKKK